MSDDVRVSLTISEYEARAGTVRVLTLPDGKQVTASIPAGSYDGQELHFPGAQTLIVTLSVPATSPAAQPGAPITPASLPPVEPPGAPPQPAEETLRTPPSLAAAAPSPSPPFPPAYGSGPDWQRGYPLPGPQPPPQGYPLPGYQPPPQSYPLPGSQPPRGRSFSGRTIALIVVIVLLILGMSGIFFAVHTAQVNADTAATATAATATGIVNAASTAQVSTQLTAQANAATAVAYATATAVQATAAVSDANPDPYGPGGKLVVLDTLDGSNSSDWTATQDCTFQGHAFHVHASGISSVRWCNYQKYSFKNFVAEVKFTTLSGDVGGFVFRGLGNAGYFLSIGTDGFCQLVRYDIGKNAPVELVRPNTASPAVRAGQNTIAVVAQGSQLTWYINSQLVGSASDSTYDTGTIGLAAGTYNNSGKASAEVAYTMFRVWVL